MKPEVGTPSGRFDMSSLTPLASFVKSTDAEKPLMSCAASAFFCKSLRHGESNGSAERKATSKYADGATSPGTAPPGVLASGSPTLGSRNRLALVSHSPAATAIRTACSPVGLNAAYGTWTSTCRRVVSTATVGVYGSLAPVAASTTSAC